jgi:hypothetical protein
MNHGAMTLAQIEAAVREGQFVMQYEQVDTCRFTEYEAADAGGPWESLGFIRKRRKLTSQRLLVSEATRNAIANAIERTPLSPPVEVLPFLSDGVAFLIDENALDKYRTHRSE